MPDSYQIKDQSAIYFVTFQVVGWVDIFSRKIYRDLILESLKFCQINKALIIYGYVVMTNHLHLILRSDNDSLSDTIRDFKRFTSREIIKSIEMSKEESRRDRTGVPVDADSICISCQTQ